MMEANLVSTPLSKTMELIVLIGSNNSPTIDVPYAKAFGSLMYAALRTQPNRAFTIQHHTARNTGLPSNMPSNT